MSAASAAFASEPPRYRWDSERFLRAWESGVFDDDRVELVEGEVWAMAPIGMWHAETTARLIALLYGLSPNERVLAGTLPSGPRSLPDPDVWVLRDGARATGGPPRLPSWDAADVLLVVEVSDTSLSADLTTKAGVYAAAGFATYWVASPEVLYVFTEPRTTGYKSRTAYRPGEQVRVPYGDATLSVTEVLGSAE